MPLRFHFENVPSSNEDVPRTHQRYAYSFENDFAIVEQYLQVPDFDCPELEMFPSIDSFLSAYFYQRQKKWAVAEE